MGTAIIMVVIVLVGLFYGYFRNNAVYNIRLSFIKDDLSDFKKLPSYDYMLFHPTQLGMWTIKQYTEKYISK